MQLNTHSSDAPLLAVSDTETLEIEIVGKRAIRRAPQSQVAKVGPTVTMALDAWLETDRKMWELFHLAELAVQQRDEAREQYEALKTERDLLAERLREWKTYARHVQERMQRAQLRNVELVHGLRAIANVARDAIEAPPLSFGWRDRLRDRFNEVANSLNGGRG